MNKPKIRFNGFEGEWKEKALGDVVDEFKYGINAAAVSYDGENKYLRITDIDEGSRAFIKDELASPDADLSSCNEYIMQDGDIVIARTGASVGKSYIYHPIDGKVYFAGFLIRARVNKNVDREFVFQNTLTDGFKKYIRFVSQRSGQPGVNAEELKSYLMNLPASLPEQRALASYFTSLDAQIAASTSRLSSLKQIKAASLLNMFPQKGETVPRVRFNGFQGEWKERKLGEIAIVNPKCDLPKSFEYVDLESVVGTEMKSHRREFRESAPSRAQRLARKGDIFYQTVRPYQKNNYLFNLDYSDYVFSSGYAQIQALKDERFLFTVVQSDYFLKQVMDNCTGTSFPSINPTLLRNLIVYDCSIDEQRAIGQYFTALDAQITLHRERLEKLKQIKAACLEKMFA